MRSIVRVLMPAVAAFSMRTALVAAQTVCGDMPVQVYTWDTTKEHAQEQALAAWQDCAVDVYGTDWGELKIAKSKLGIICTRHNDGWGRYELPGRHVTCSGGASSNMSTWQCYLIATPCRLNEFNKPH